MASLTPEIDAFQGAQQFGMRQQLGSMQQLSELQKIMAVQAATQQREGALMREKQMRGALSQLPSDATQEQVMQVVRPYLGADDIVKHYDTNARISATKQIAADKLKVQADELRRKATRQEDKDAVDRWEAQGMMAIRLGKAGYELPAQNVPTLAPFPSPSAPAGPALATPAAGGTPAQPTAPVMAPQVASNQILRGSAPTYADALARFRADPSTPMTLEYPEATGPAFGGAPNASPEPFVPSVTAAPNNLDTRDLRLQNAPRPAPAAPTGRPDAVMPTFSGSPKEITAQQNRWRQEQAKTSIAGAGRLTPEALQTVAEQYLAGDRQAIQGYARDQATKSAIQNEIVKQAKAKGWNGNDIANQMADFAATMSGARTVGTRAANIELAASEAEKMMDIASAESKQFLRTQFPAINVALKAYETQTGEPGIRRFGAAINSLVNVYGRAISPSGVATVSDKEHAREMLKDVDSPEAFAGVLEVMRKEMEAAKAAPEIVSAARAKRITGRGNSATPATESGASDFSAQVRNAGWDYEPNKYDYRVVDGKVQRKPK